MCSNKWNNSSGCGNKGIVLVDVVVAVRVNVVIGIR